MRKTVFALMAMVTMGSLYPTGGVVTDRSGDFATVTTSTGIEYSVQCDDACPGDVMALIAYKNGTAEVTDDKVIASKYIGTISMLQETFENAVYDYYFGM